MKLQEKLQDKGRDKGRDEGTGGGEQAADEAITHPVIDQVFSCALKEKWHQRRISTWAGAGAGAAARSGGRVRLALGVCARAVRRNANPVESKTIKGRVGKWT